MAQAWKVHLDFFLFFLCANQTISSSFLMVNITTNEETTSAYASFTLLFGAKVV
jgi:hypothetical protein